MDKKTLSERDICTKYILPAITKSGWKQNQIREEYEFAAGRVIVQGKLYLRGNRKRADIVLFYQSNIPIAVIEAKRNDKPLGGGMI